MLEKPVSGPGGVKDSELTGPSRPPLTISGRITPEMDQPYLDHVTIEEIGPNEPFTARKREQMKATFPKDSQARIDSINKYNESGTKSQFYTAGLLPYPGEDAPGKMGNL